MDLSTVPPDGVPLSYFGLSIDKCLGLATPILEAMMATPGRDGFAFEINREGGALLYAEVDRSGISITIEKPFIFGGIWASRLGLTRKKKHVRITIAEAQNLIRQFATERKR